MVQAIFDTPVPANGPAERFNGINTRGQMVGALFLAEFVAPLCRIEALDFALDFEYGAEVIVPGFGTGAGRQRPKPDGPLFDSMVLAYIGFIALLGGRVVLAERANGSLQLGVVPLQLHQQVSPQFERKTA